MPTPVEMLWDVLEKNQYDSAKKIINAHPDKDLINSMNYAGVSVLARSCMVKPYALDFLQFIANHPNLNLQAQNPKTKDTNVKIIISTASLELFKLFETKKGIIYNGDVLSYEHAKKRLQTLIWAYESDFKKDPNSASTKSYATKVEGLKYILTTLRELTIRHAVEKDDPRLFEQLEKAGDDLNKPLSDGILPIRLLKKANVKVGEWFDKRLERTWSSTISMSGNPHVMEMFQAKDALDTLNVAHHKKQAELYAKGAKEGNDLLFNVQ